MHLESTYNQMFPRTFFGGGGGGGEILREINGQDHQRSVRAYAQSGHGHFDLLSALRNNV